MGESNVEVKAICNRYHNAFIVDLDLLCAMRGCGFSLINRRGACKFLSCGGSPVFLYRTGKITPFFPLKERSTISHERC
jgi:hypothetical protein